MIICEMVPHLEASHGLHVVNVSAAFLVEKHVAKLSTTGIEMKPICSLQCIRDVKMERGSQLCGALFYWLPQPAALRWGL